ncbi:NAD(P)-binding protein [Pisolithus albus]|nr:NAD(P)-binding protein [Pisolithus albus]
MPNINDVKCILIIGSTSGLGRDLALSILELPPSPPLDELVSSHGADGRLRAVKLDVTADRATLKATIDDIIKTYPDLDAVMFSSGVQYGSDFCKPETINLDDFLVEIHTNYTSVVTMITFFLPHLISLGESGRPTFLYTISSGLGMMPGPSVANYSATKAAIHSLSISLNVQLKEKNVRVVEILPPQGTTETLSKYWMSLTEFTKLTMAQLSTDAAQIPIGMAAHAYEKYEAGKLEAVDKSYELHKVTSHK